MKLQILKKREGFTLIELLAVLAISGLIITLIYGVLISGVSLFNKGSTETLMRQDADIVMTNIVNDFFDNKGESTSAQVAGSQIIINNTPISSDQFNYSDSTIKFRAAKTMEVELVIRSNGSKNNHNELRLSSTLYYPWGE